MEMEEKATDAHVEWTVKSGAEVITDDEDPNESILQAIKKNTWAIIYCCFMTVSPLLYGYDVITAGVVTAMPGFQESFGTYQGDYSWLLPAMWISLWTTMMPVGVMFGSLTCSYITDRFGTRVSSIGGGFIAIAGALLSFFSDLLLELNARRGLFTGSKAILGYGLGLMLPASQTYVSEVAPVRLRGALLSLFTISMLIGQIISIAGIDVRLMNFTPDSYRILFAAEIVPTGVAMILAFFCPESPSIYAKLGKRAQAIKAYSRLFPTKDAEEAVAKIESSLEHERQIQASEEKPGYMECFQGTNWRRTRIVLYANMVQNFAGIAMIAQSTYFMELGGMSYTISLNVTTALLCVAIPGYISAWYTMNVYGRRNTMLWACIGIAILWLIIGIIGCFKAERAFWAVGCLIVVVNFIYAMGVGSVYPVIASETSTLRLRAKTQSVGFFVQFLTTWAFGFSVPYMYETNEGDMGGKIGFIFAFLSVVAWVVFYLEVPEMMNRTIAEIDELFERKTPTKEFKKTVL
ncbi:hypothetical protein N7466_002681 [Penicillium verhagenii]|uniref:uncharacterized protein n=1 Tax=Penicillium verhagenii TaxID=1562060 RepID=UPI00254507B5|nr:uncharacterized protein N7466_002681 [Penicillium verhagenii]KAJ5939547.1 hypothetical protein N7466_002681 [Penicillium verhagenii]